MIVVPVLYRNWSVVSEEAGIAWVSDDSWKPSISDPVPGLPVGSYVPFRAQCAGSVFCANDPSRPLSFPTAVCFVRVSECR